MTSADSTFKFDEIGYWSELKLEIVEKYGAAYTGAFRNARNLKKNTMSMPLAALVFTYRSERKSRSKAAPRER